LLIGLSAASNLAAALWLRRRAAIPEEALAGLMGLDVLVLTGLLAWSGGPANPFSTIYLVNIALAAVVLRPAWAWGLASFSLACFGLLFFAPIAGPFAGAMSHGAHGEELASPRRMRVAFGACAAFIATSSSVTGELGGVHQTRGRAPRAPVQGSSHAGTTSVGLLRARRRSRRSGWSRRRFDEARRFGEAHRFDEARRLDDAPLLDDDRQRSGEARFAEIRSARDDARLIREQVDRCREILDRMAGEAGETPGESFVDLTFAELIAQSTDDLAAGGRVEVAIDPALAEQVSKLRGPSRGPEPSRTRSKRPGRVPVTVEARRGRRLTIEIRDRGAGMSAILSRVGEPCCTKRPGAGGAGVFLRGSSCEPRGHRLPPTGRGDGPGPPHFTGRIRPRAARTPFRLLRIRDDSWNDDRPLDVARRAAWLARARRDARPGAGVRAGRASATPDCSATSSARRGASVTISFNLRDRTVTGNVFKTDGSRPPSGARCERRTNPDRPRSSTRWTATAPTRARRRLLRAAWPLIASGLVIDGSFLLPWREVHPERQRAAILDAHARTR
jgi:two-component system sensor histidine kinase RegB